MTNVDTSNPSSHRGYLVDRRWEPQFAALGSKRARRGYAYQAYVPLPIAEEDFSISSHIAAGAANAELATRQLGESPPSGLNLENIARQLLRAESVASSRIEGFLISHRRLAKAAFNPAGDVTAQSVLGNIRALERAVELASSVEELTPEHLLEVHRLLFADTRDEHLGGILRQEQNWIGGAATGPSNAEFVPPPPELVEELVIDLCRFSSRDDIPAVIQAAVAHVQLETIHPFLDGNGRVGRALIFVILRRRGTATRSLPPVSLVLARRADRYIQGLKSFRMGNEEDWFSLFNDAVHTAATGARSFAESVGQLQQRWLEQAGKPRRGSGPQRLIEALPANPIVNVSCVAQILGGSEEQARLAVQRLEQAGVLRQTTVGRRNRAWECLGLFDLLDNFEREYGPDGRTPRPTR